MYRDSEKREQGKLKLELLEQRKAHAAQVRARAKRVEKGEKNTSFQNTLNLEKSTANARIMWEIIYLSLHCHHQNDSCIKPMGSDESHFNSSVQSDGQSHKTVSTNHNLSEEKGEPKRF